MTLRTLLADACQINVATGIVMATHSLSADQARAVMERTSEAAGLQLVELARRLISTCT